MASFRRLPRDQWERKLRSYNCYPAEGMTALNTAEWWRWPFRGPPFTVPADDEGFIDVRDMQKLMSDMARLAPDDWAFPSILEP